MCLCRPLPRSWVCSVKSGLSESSGSLGSPLRPLSRIFQIVSLRQSWVRFLRQLVESAHQFGSFKLVLWVSSESGFWWSSLSQQTKPTILSQFFESALNQVFETACWVSALSQLFESALLSQFFESALIQGLRQLVESVPWVSSLCRLF